MDIKVNSAALTSLSPIELSTSVSKEYIWRPPGSPVKLAWAAQPYLTINLLSSHDGKGCLHKHQQ